MHLAQTKCMQCFSLNVCDLGGSVGWKFFPPYLFILASQLFFEKEVLGWDSEHILPEG
jgi:hypothetical protein